MRIDEHSALIVVDVQPDFLPGGALAVGGGDEILEPIAHLLASNRFRHVVATQDWHPPGHVSFASSHPSRHPFERITLYGHEQVLWPDHCVQGTPGAALQAKMPWHSADAIIRKGADPDVDSYSAFRNNWDRSGRRPPTGLAGYLREREIASVFVCGLARDYCVSWSAQDARAAGFATAVLWDLTRSVDPSSDAALESRLRSLGIVIGESAEIDS
jgi:nicotinamidase/pyrazinamidase